MERYWLKIRKIGKIPFIIGGALLFVLLIVLFSTILRIIMTKDFNPSLIFSVDSLGPYIGGLLGGLMFSTSQWYLEELKTKEKK
ncbi:MAG: hypothetical protein A2X19_01870 [Bacteroidetes bacterium GWE2_39_28]|nr:MAG: hypothetical protein A2X19_01870 [Bacteroidetes bacterium GWE2_39_28]OFZ10031.1 MAG: hypothetical protein A2465_07090 [Bacteroidetes bacterium RIFOXYC2_FULL_39_11]